MSWKEKAKFGKDIFKTLADAFRQNFDLWNSLQFEEWVRLEDAEKEIKTRDDLCERLMKILEHKDKERLEWKQKLQQTINELRHKPSPNERGEWYQEGWLDAMGLAIKKFEGLLKEAQP